jgi:hypothetical protein
MHSDIFMREHCPLCQQSLSYKENEAWCLKEHYRSDGKDSFVEYFYSTNYLFAIASWRLTVFIRERFTNKFFKVDKSAILSLNLNESNIDSKIGMLIFYE